MSKKLKRLGKKIVYPIRNTVLWLNYILGRYKEVVWIIGDGRSGTTWVSDIINYDNRFRELFEPFHPDWVHQMSFLQYHQYIRPFNGSEKFNAIAGKVFSGNFYHPRIDRTSRKLLYDGLLLKDISTNLFAYHVHQKFKNVKIALLVRNPFAVAVSKYKKKKWNWMNEPERFLEQKFLYQDHLKPFEYIIREVANDDDYIVKQVLIWCVINYVPLKQFKKSELCVIFYENLVMNPNVETARIINELGLGSTAKPVKIPQSLIDKPSIVSDQRTVPFSQTLNSWREEISEIQYKKGLEILEYFGFGELYDPNSLPNAQVVEKLMN